MKKISVSLTVLLVLILLASFKASAAYVSFAFTNSLGAPITNDFRLVKVGDTLADGSVIPQGLPIRVTPASDGRATNRLQTGNWYATNSYLSQAIKFRVPQDDGPTVYFFTDPGIWISGGSYFVTQVIGGSNAAPTYNQVTNALGYLPLTQSKLDDTNTALIARIVATNSLNMAATVTNVGGFATNITIKASGGASSKALRVFDHTGVEQSYIDDQGVYFPVVAAESGALAGINNDGKLIKFTGPITNNTSGSSSLATNAINATNVYGAGLTLITNAATTVAGNATNNLNTALVARIANSTNDLNTTLGTRIIATNDLLVTRITAATNGLNSALVTRIQNATNDLNTALVAADTVVSNGLSSRLVATNTALANRMDDATNSLNTTISTRITNATNSLNSALVARIQNATNDLNTALVAADTIVSNGLSVRLIATNAALISADTVVSNGLSARLIATNTSLQGQILNATNGLNSALVAKITDATNSLNTALVVADTAVSNGLSARLIATNAALLVNDTTVSNGLSARLLATNTALTTRISDSTNSLNTVLMSQISATTNDYKVRVIAAGTNITVLTNATAGIYTVSGSFDSNSVYAIGLQAAYTVGGATGGVTVATANTLAQTNIAWRVPNMLLSGTNLFPGAAVTGTLTNNTAGNAAGATNIYGAAVTTVASIAATNAAWADTNGATSFVGEGASLTNLNLYSLRQRAWDDWSLNWENIPKIKKQLAQQGSLKLLVFSDDAIIGSGEFHRAMVQNLSQTMTRGGTLTVASPYCYLLGDGAGYVTHAGQGSTEFFQSGWIGFNSGTENMTNIITTGAGLPTSHLSVTCALLNGGGTYTVSTQAIVNGVYTAAKGTAFSFSADNGGAPVPFVTNFYLGGEFNVVASISSSGGTTNILQSLGQWTTNNNTFVYDIWDIGGMEWLTAMTNSFQSNHIAMCATNYDAIIIADAGYVYLGAQNADALWQSKSLTADLVYLGINPNTNQTYAQNIAARLAYTTLGTNGRPFLDVGSVFWSALYSPGSNSIVHSLYADGAHVTVPGGDMTANFVSRKLGLTASELMSFGYNQRITGTNYFRISPFNSHVVVSGTINNTAPAWADPFYFNYGSRFISSYFLPTAARQFATDIPGSLMLDRKTIVLKQYWMTTNAQIISVKSKIYKANTIDGTAASDIGAAAGNYTQTASGNVVFTTSITNSFTYPGREGDLYTALIGWGDTGTITNGLWWLGADVWMY